jgi:hypothetical protein
MAGWTYGATIAWNFAEADVVNLRVAIFRVPAARSLTSSP